MSNISEDPQVHIKSTKEAVPKNGSMAAAVRFTATITCDGRTVQVGSAVLCVPTDASMARQGFLQILDINPSAPNTDMVAQAFFEAARQWPEVQGRQIVSIYKGMPTKAEPWLKQFADDIFLIMPQAQTA